MQFFVCAYSLLKNTDLASESMFFRGVYFKNGL